MEDGLEKKAVSFLVDQLLSYPQKRWKSKSRICCNVLYTISRWSKGGQYQPRIINKAFMGYRWHVLTLRCKWMPSIKLVGE